VAKRAALTPFVESEVILMATLKDDDAMNALLDEMTEHERQMLALACERVIDAIEGMNE
jgi:predicted nucleic acid-binding protein